jgi:hypothetical protein
MAYTIRPATLGDALILKEGLTSADAEELQAAQVPPLRAITQGIRHSLSPVSVFDKDEHLAAIAGVVPQDPQCLRGAPWMLTTRFAGTEPIAFVKQAKKWVDHELTQFPVLEHQVYRHNTAHIRLLSLLGFTVLAPSSYGQLFLKFFQFFQ